MLVTFKMITLLVAFCFICICSGDMGSEPKFILIFDSSLHVCPDADSDARVDTSTVEVYYHNETSSSLTGVITFHEEMELNTMVELTVEKEVSGQFEKMLTHEICDLCAELHVDSPYYKYLKFFGFPEECPFPKGGYPIHNFVPPPDDLPLTSSNKGRYQATVMFYSNPDGSCKNEKTFLFCLKLSFLIEESFE